MNWKFVENDKSQNYIDRSKKSEYWVLSETLRKSEYLGMSIEYDTQKN